jgi:hypothetical protein
MRANPPNPLEPTSRRASLSFPQLAGQIYDLRYFVLGLRAMPNQPQKRTFMGLAL